MANIHRGEVDFVVDGTTYKLRLSTNALCELESVAQMKATEAIAILLESSGKDVAIDFRVLRAILWAAMTGGHNMALSDVGDLIDVAGLKVAFEAVAKVIVAAFPKEAKGETPPANPT